MNDIFLIAAPERHVLPGGFIDADAKTLEVYRCHRDGSWWMVTQ